MPRAKLVMHGRLLACLIASLLLPGALARPTVQATPTIHLASTDYPPYFSPALRNDGVVGAITRAALAKRGYSVQLHYRPWSRLMAEVQAGSFDGVMAVWYSPEREQYLYYSQPLVYTSMGFYTRVDQPLAVAPLSALKPYTIGTVRGYKNPPAFDAARLKVEAANDDLTNLRKLAAGRLDLVLIDRALAGYLLPQLAPGMAERIHWQGPPIARMPLHLGFYRGNKSGEQLTRQFNLGLAELRHSGELAAILQRYRFEQ